MTIKQAIDTRIPRVRKPIWNAKAYMRLPLLRGGTHGPWAELYDEPGQLACDVKVGSQKFCVALHEVLSDDGYEAYEGQPHPAEQVNFAATYSEV
jgi:hypothetical protein